MATSNALKAKTLALAIAIGAGVPATAVRADELQDLKAQLEALQNQIEALQKKLGEMDVKQHTQPVGSVGADHAKGPAVAADDGSLTFHSNRIAQPSCT